MKFDVVIIGGGLSGLVCGISLQRKGKRCAIVSAGQSALHFSSGYLDLLDRTPDGREVLVPAESIGELPDSHPYSKIGAEVFGRYLGEVKPLFAGCGVTLKGDEGRNCYRITPMGGVRPSWLCLSDFTPFTTSEAPIGAKVLVVNIPGFLDFNAGFIADGIVQRGSSCRVVDISIDELAHLRANPSEMRSSNIARAMDSNATAMKFAEAVRARLDGDDAVVLPAVFGLKDCSVPQKIADAIGVRTEYVATMTPSVPGIRTQMRLKNAFERFGGTFLAGDTVISAEMDCNRVKSVVTANFGEERIEADDFVLATGSFFSKGLSASKDEVSEPVFGLDMYSLEDRSKWGDTGFFRKQEYIGFGVVSDNSFRASKAGETMENLYVAGAVCGGFNPLAEGCGAGTSIMSALAVAEHIISKI
ncbi:MAG: glycerol-3-phosphate dehydrogenase subunit GlpB [Clostridium sp.]|nr:glycerol-3-phosphate dehydrogenase subunit GlpB [Bacteroides sp.]MCM1198327.1 glycerol-3-phosphate dehydrogenase subunit GlpB [Clostridium sp.]